MSSRVSSLPWVEKYRPQVLSEMSLPELTREAIENVILSAKAMPHLMLYGPPGTGKTSVAKIICQSFFGSKKLARLNTLELNAGDDRGIQCVRNHIKQFASNDISISSFFDKSIALEPMHQFKIVILDECDSLTSDAQAMLRQVVEQYSASCRFFFVCNDIAKMIDPIISRCKSIAFGRMDDKSLIKCLSRIVHGESIDIGVAELAAIVDISGGDARRAINYLHVLANQSTRPDQKKVYALVNRVDPSNLQTLLKSIMHQEFPDVDACQTTVNSILDGHVNVPILMQDMALEAAHLLDGQALSRVVRKLAKTQLRVSLGGSPRLALMNLLMNCADE